MNTSSVHRRSLCRFRPTRSAVRLGAMFAAVLTASMFAATAWAQPLDTPQPVLPPADAPPPPVAKPETEQDKPKPAERGSPRPAEAATPEELPPDFIKLHLMDGSVIAGRLSMKEIEVDTQFGKLNVPVSSIRNITPGLASHPALAKQISGLIADLGSGNYNDRERAQQALVKMGPQIRGELERHRNDNDVERRNRVRAILTEFEQMAEDLDLEADALAPLREGDTIETTEFTIVGKIVPQSFVMASPYGELNVKLADIRRGQRETGKIEDVRESFTVDASHFAYRNPLNTNIRVQRGDTVTITADGTLTMTPWGPQATSTPEGAPNYGWFVPNQIPSGALVGKIGSENFRKLGSKMTFTAERSGVLQLAIGMQANYGEQQFPGKYSVKVRVQPK